ncbi:MAG TPA: fibrillarin-like rRNA/tRNA 2'-O-methyltransferase [Thermoplasmata archaeon]|nr:fibrillarin-like rRNA/tRNA 2'-O-methyltransferase [Thermoplasmata archaeon]
MDPSEWPGVYRIGRDLYTRNAVPGETVYGEDLRSESGTEYRRWDPWRSKLAAFLLKGAPAPLWDAARTVLYLGAAHGTTVSHLSDALPGATVFAVEKSPPVFAPLLALARRRANIVPILADAQLPERYAADVGPVDLLVQDVAQRDQPRIYRENALACRARRGILMLKIRSVTQRLPPDRVVRDARRELSALGGRVGTGIDLGPFSREHVALSIER